LCETVRTELGPRQRVVATLGKLSEHDLAAGWEDIKALLEGRKPAPRQLLVEKAKDTPNPPSSEQWELADSVNLSVERVRVTGHFKLYHPRSNQSVPPRGLGFLGLFGCSWQGLVGCF
jgi:hypothetical protein